MNIDCDLLSFVLRGNLLAKVISFFAIAGIAVILAGRECRFGLRGDNVERKVGYAPLTDVLLDGWVAKMEPLRTRSGMSSRGLTVGRDGDVLRAFLAAAP
jgi:hypothetical protein